MRVYLMGNFLQAVQSSYMIQSVYGGRQASVETEDLRWDKRDRVTKLTGR